MNPFLGLIALGNRLFLPRAAPPSDIVSGLSQVGGSKAVKGLGDFLQIK